MCVCALRRGDTASSSSSSSSIGGASVAAPEIEESEVSVLRL